PRARLLDSACRCRAVDANSRHWKEDRRADGPRVEGSPCRGRAARRRQWRRTITRGSRTRRPGLRTREPGLSSAAGREGRRRGTCARRRRFIRRRIEGRTAGIDAMNERLVTAGRVEDDAQYEAGLRPRSLDEYIGQDRVRDNLDVSIAAARGRKEALDHVLLYGPPGLGKTTLAYVIGNELGVPVRATAGPVIEKPGDLAAMLTNLQQ